MLLFCYYVFHEAVIRVDDLFVVLKFLSLIQINYIIYLVFLLMLALSMFRLQNCLSNHLL